MIEAATTVLNEEYNLFDQKQSKIGSIYDDAPSEFQRQFKSEIYTDMPDSYADFHRSKIL